MAVEFLLPDVGEGLTEAEIVRWLVAVGDRVREDQPMVEIQTDKAVTEMPAPATGVVARLGGAEGDLLQVGDVLLVIDDGQAATTVVGGAHTSPHARPDSARLVVTDKPVATSARPLATPSTRALARSLGVDLRDLVASGPGGRITDDDVRAASTPPAAVRTDVSARRPPLISAITTADDVRIAFRGIRRRTAENMTASWQNVPHVSSFAEVDVTELFSIRAQIRTAAEARGIELTLTAFFVRATALALRSFPDMNASLDLEAGEIVQWGHRNIGVAVDTENGLILPVVRDADHASLFSIAKQLHGVTTAARDRSLSLAAMSGGTFTISNYGPIGGWFGTSLVHGNEVGVLGFGPAVAKPVVRDGVIAIGNVMVINAGADHRVVDGRQIIGFVTTVKQLLEQPAQLLLDEV